MTTEPRTAQRADEGFTLIEVLVAMMILAIGLLGLEALGIGAARSLAQADDRGELVAVASGAMEEAQQAIRAGLMASPVAVAVGETCTTAPGGIDVCTEVQTRATLATLSQGNARITVTASAAAGSAEEFAITSYVFDPNLP